MPHVDDATSIKSQIIQKEQKAIAQTSLLLFFLWRRFYQLEQFKTHTEYAVFIIVTDNLEIPYL